MSAPADTQFLATSDSVIAGPTVFNITYVFTAWSPACGRDGQTDVAQTQLPIRKLCLTVILPLTFTLLLLQQRHKHCYWNLEVTQTLLLLHQGNLQKLLSDGNTTAHVHTITAAAVTQTLLLPSRSDNYIVTTAAGKLAETYV